MEAQILIVDDDAGIRQALTLLFEDRGTFRTQAVDGGREALARLERDRFDLVLCDVAMPGMDGIALLSEIKKSRPELPVIMVSAHGELETAVQAVRTGAYDYLTKPVDEDRLFTTIDRALAHRRLQKDYEAVRQEAREELDLLGESEPMERLRREIERAAPTDARILIHGENGTGKELVAKLIHERSARVDRPFLKLNSAALPKDLIESELFGHEAGAFTGAVKQKKGKFELADGGTLFLDEIGDMAPDTQAKLLRVLSVGEVERVGGSRPTSFDVRLLTATNRDLPAEIAAGAFREDLYHRIAVIPIRVPALRERGRDVALLADHFLSRYCARYRRTPPLLTEEAQRLLLHYPWPGNVRELRNVTERIAIMHPEPTLDFEDLEPLLTFRPRGSGSDNARAVLPGGRLVEQWRAEQKAEERSRVEKTLHDAGWNVTFAAERLGIDRASLHRKMKRLGIARPGRPIEGSEE